MEDFREAQDGGHGRADFVAHVGQEFAFGPAGGFCRFLGHKFLQLVRANSRFRETPVIFCTALGERSDVIRAVNLGITDYIVKPVDANILLSKVKKILVKNEQSSRPQRDKEAVEPVSNESPE